MILEKFLDDFEVKTLTSLGRTDNHLWETGRQHTGYEKLALRALVDADPLYRALAHRALGHIARIGSLHENHWDMWLLRYPDGSYIPPHRDEATIFGLQHRRLNAVVHAPLAGGDFIMEGEHVPLAVGDAVLFYPDQSEHEVTKVSGVRLVFSVGAWLKGHS